MTSLEELESATTAPQVQESSIGASEEQLHPVDADAVATETAQARKGSRWLREAIETILLTFVIFVAINALTGRFRVEGPSMKPTLHEGQYLIISKIVYKLHPPQRGDIIVFHHPRNATRDLIKRVIGLPGETVQVRQGRVYVDDVPLEEPYIVDSGSRSVHYQLGPDDYFVLGDNRPNSEDSRAWGVLKRDQIVGKAWVSYWPPTDWGPVSHYDYRDNAAAQGQVGIKDDHQERQPEIFQRTLIRE